MKLSDFYGYISFNKKYIFLLKIGLVTFSEKSSFLIRDFEMKLQITFRTYIMYYN